MSVCVYRMCLYMHWRPEGDKERSCSLYIGHILVNVFIVYLLLLYYNINVYYVCMGLCACMYLYHGIFDVYTICT